MYSKIAEPSSARVCPDFSGCAMKSQVTWSRFARFVALRNQPG